MARVHEVIVVILLASAGCVEVQCDNSSRVGEWRQNDLYHLLPSVGPMNRNNATDLPFPNPATPDAGSVGKVRWERADLDAEFVALPWDQELNGTVLVVHPSTSVNISELRGQAEAFVTRITGAKNRDDIENMLALLGECKSSTCTELHPARLKLRNLANLTHFAKELLDPGPVVQRGTNTWGQQFGDGWQIEWYGSIRQYAWNNETVKVTLTVTPFGDAGAVVENIPRRDQDLSPDEFNAAIAATLGDLGTSPSNSVGSRPDCV